MTAPTPQSTRDAATTDALNPANLDGHTIQELSAYLDAERTPTNFSIESSPGLSDRPDGAWPFGRADRA